MNCQAERLTPPVAYHGEGPLFDPARNRLLCMDVMAGVIVAVDSAGGISRHKVPSRAVTVVRHRVSGGFVVAIERGVMTCDADFGAFDVVARLPIGVGIRTNDGGCDPLGGFVVGTMAYDERPGAGAVYRVGSDHQAVELLAPVTISNGIQWSCDGSRAFYVDTPTRRVDVFDVDPLNGALSGRRTHILLDQTFGYPDGMAIDEDDGLWIALWGGGVVQHFDATGRLVESVKVPGVTQVSSCTFGGEGSDVLFISTSRQGLRSDEEPDAGALFRYETDARGQIPWEYSG